MNWVNIISLIVAIVSAIVIPAYAWIFKNINDRIKNMEDRLSNINFKDLENIKYNDIKGLECKIEKLTELVTDKVNKDIKSLEEYVNVRIEKLNDQVVTPEILNLTLEKHFAQFEIKLLMESKEDKKNK